MSRRLIDEQLRKLHMRNIGGWAWARSPDGRWHGFRGPEVMQVAECSPMKAVGIPMRHDDHKVTILLADGTEIPSRHSFADVMREVARSERQHYFAHVRLQRLSCGGDEAGGAEEYEEDPEEIEAED